MKTRIGRRRCVGTLSALLVVAIALATACRPLVTEATPVAVDTAVPEAPTGVGATEVLPTETPEEVEPLTEDALMNAEYQGIYEDPVRLTDGLYEGEPFEEGGASRPTVTFSGAYALGDLDGDGLEDAVVVLAENSGGSGTFVYLAAVLNRDGRVENGATTLLGDRVQVQKVDIVAAGIRVVSISHGPDDPMCCPSQKVVQVFALKGGDLVLATTEVVSGGAGDMRATAVDVVGVLWQWWGLVEVAPAAQSLVPNPEDYTLLLAKDGTIVIKADCNVVGGSYKLDGDQLAIELGPTTLAECSDESLERQYIGLLDTVESLSLDGDQLVLHLARDAGRMIFAAPAITTVTWQWSRLVETDPAAQSIVPDPENYTLRLEPDGTLRIKSDCNDVGGSYQLQGAALAIELGPTTLAECGDESLDQQYLRLLASVESFSLEEGQLMLRLGRDAGRMIFTVPVVTFITWEWQELVEMEPAALSIVPDPENYTLMLAPDGTVRIKADCSDVGGAYRLEDDALAIELGPTTLAECAEGSLDQQFLGLLARVEHYSLQAGQLVLYLAGNAGRMAFAPPVASLVTWEWSELVETEPAAQSVVPDPENYTLLLRPDGTVRIRADCNAVGGSYTLGGGALAIELGPTTLAECAEGSLDRQYLGLLATVEGYSLEDGQLVLTLAGGGGHMTFRDAGLSPGR